MTPSFEAPDLARQAEAMSDALRSGVISLDAGGVVQADSRTEAAPSGRKQRPTIGLDVFAEVAPRMASPEIRIRVMSAAEGGRWLFRRREAS